jgi:hypothetical protein
MATLSVLYSIIRAAVGARGYNYFFVFTCSRMEIREERPAFVALRRGKHRR